MLHSDAEMELEPLFQIGSGILEHQAGGEGTHYFIEQPDDLSTPTREDQARKRPIAWLGLGEHSARVRSKRTRNIKVNLCALSFQLNIEFITAVS